jgi:DNA-binding Lrp family transcriptional regulator
MRRKSDTLIPDELDRRLLALLRQNARLPIATLSKSLDISRASVYARLKHLQIRGVIEGYTVRLNPDYDRRLIRAHVMMNVAVKLAKATEKQLRGMPEVIELHAISGVYDLIAILEAESAAELNELIDRIGALEGVEKTTSSILLATKWLR